jgi:hypothetical protein
VKWRLAAALFWLASGANHFLEPSIRSGLPAGTGGDEHDPILARELDATVRTGAFCVHQPDPRHPLGWSVDAG